MGVGFESRIRPVINIFELSSLNAPKTRLHHKAQGQRPSTTQEVWVCTVVVLLPFMDLNI